MTAQGRRKRLTKKAVAQAAVELIDESGLAALTMRAVAAKLNVDPMALYRVVSDRDGLVSDVVECLLDEVDESERPGETWDQTMRRVLTSEREMALRHPAAYGLVAAASTREGPGLWNAYRLMRLLATSGMSEEDFFDMWLLVDPWFTGFLLLETDIRAHATATAVGQSELDASWASKMATTISERAFWLGVERIFAAVDATLAAKKPSPTRGQERPVEVADRP